METGGNVSCEPILLKNSLLRLQIFRNQKAVLRSSKHIQKCREISEIQNIISPNLPRTPGFGDFQQNKP
jgi:hypothetical protein